MGDTTLHRVVEFGLARRLGIPVIVQEDAKSTWWNGSVLIMSPHDGSSLTHEMGHWIVAKKHGELGRIDFGCSPGMSSSHFVSPLDYLGPETVRVREEEADFVEGIIAAVIDAAVRELGSRGVSG